MHAVREVRSAIRSHRDLVVWQKSMDLVDLIYDLSDHFPRKEQRVLIPQITRSVISVAANIAEGQGRYTARDFANFLVISEGSLMEADTMLTVAVRRHYVTEQAAQPAYNLITEIGKMLWSLRARIRASGRK
jgi:four helix bundle protein